MQTRARRQLDMVLLGAGVVLAGLAGLGGAALGAVVRDPEEINGFWTSATVRDDGSARVVEAIDYDFGLKSQHGILRFVPGLPSTGAITVESDAPSQHTVTERFDGATEVKIGDPNATVSGEHRYTIGYDLPGVVRGTALDWETMGNRWEVDANNVEVHVVAPFELGNPVCVTGPVGSTTPCDSIEEVEPGHLVAHVDEVPSGSGVSVEATPGAALDATPATPSPPPPIRDEKSDGTGVMPPALAAAGGAAIASIPVSRLVRRAGREKVSAGGAADVAYAGQPARAPAPPAEYASWPTAAGPYGTHAGAAAAGAPGGPGDRPPPPGAPGAAVAGATLPPPPIEPPAGRSTLPPPPGAPGASGGPAVPADRHGPSGRFGTIFAPSGHPVPPPPPSVGRIGEPIAGPPQWLPDDDLRLDEAELAEMATIEFAPPAELTPAHGGIVLEEAVKPNHKAAWLVQAAIDGDIEIEESGQTATGLVRLRPGSPETAMFLDRAFNGRGEVSLLSYDKHFAGAWTALDSQLDSWRRESGLWDRAGDRRRVMWRVWAVLGFIFAVGLTVGGALVANIWGAGALPIVLAGGLLGGAALAVLIRAWELRVRTAAGSGLWLRVESFRRFLAGSEAYHAEEAARRGVLREYTAWALALGEIDRWRMAVMSSPNIPLDTPGLGYVWLGASLVASTSSAATAPSSSGGGGGFGGGSVGGGAGGGGGGSW